MSKYWYCGVAVKGVDTVYSYISDMGQIAVGSYVAVPFGYENDLRIGVVKTSAEYAENEAPYPVCRTKHIIRLATEEEYGTQGSLSPYSNDDDDDDELYEVECAIEAGEWDEVLQWAVFHHESADPVIIQKVIACYELCIKQNMAVAALNLGTFYYTGRFVEQDYHMAYELYKIAADAGELRAICNCGYCFYYGRHQKVDYAQAFQYFSLGALLFDDANCLYKLGDMYLNGYGVDKNETYAYKMYTRALDRCQDSEQEADVTADAQFRVGKCLLQGIGTERNVEKAYILLCLALLNFYKRRKTDIFVGGLINGAKELITEAQSLLDREIGGAK